ncbi:MAG: PQQ-like beta-propeller repeat protein, partial [Verrucomicrobiales bacterium]|nr:PQQ-like beta-propeller repeat protein [Verrucomicrobiales bacterium]
MIEIPREPKQFAEMFRSLAIPAFCVFCAGTIQGADWPQWRGPNRDGVWPESGLLESFPAAGPEIKWRVPAGYGFSSPVVAQGRVCLSDSQLKSPNVEARVRCFDEKTGAMLWVFSQNLPFPDWAFVRGQEACPNGTPVLRDDRIYALGPNGRVIFCLDAVNGVLLWQKDLAKDYQIDEKTALSSSPLLDGNRLILLPGGKPGAGVVALDAVSGREIWRSLDESAGHSSPIIIQAGGVRQLIVWTLQSVTSLDPLTGKLLWREPFACGSSDVVATPVVDSDRLLISGFLLKLDQRQPAASALWPETRAPTKRVLSSTSTPLLRGNLVFSAGRSGKLVCLDAATGNQIWETDKVTDGKSGAATSIHLTLNGDSVL